MTDVVQANGCANLSYKHDIKKTHVSFIEFDDVMFTKLAKDVKYFGEGNSKGRVLEFDFEYCLNCNLRLLDGKPIMTKDILEAEFERLVIKAKNNKIILRKNLQLKFIHNLVFNNKDWSYVNYNNLFIRPFQSVEKSYLYLDPNIIEIFFNFNV